MTTATCQVRVSRDQWHFGPCGRPVKGKLENGEDACQMHINVEKRRRARQAKFEHEWKEMERLDGLAERRASELTKLLGITVHSAPNRKREGLNNYDPDHMVVSYEDLKRLAGEEH